MKKRRTISWLFITIKYYYALATRKIEKKGPFWPQTEETKLPQQLLTLKVDMLFVIHFLLVSHALKVGPSWLGKLRCYDNIPALEL